MDEQQLIEAMQALLGGGGDAGAPVDPYMDPDKVGGDQMAAGPGTAFGPVPPSEPAPPPPAPVMAGTSFGQSAGYGMGPGNKATGQDLWAPDLPQEQRFGDASKNWQVEGYRPLAPTMQAIARSEKVWDDLDRRGTNVGPLAGSVLNRMGQIQAERDNVRWSPDYQAQYEGRWVDDAANNNLARVRPELQADGSVRRVYEYEGGRTQAEGYKAAPPPRPTYRGGGPPPPKVPYEPPDMSYRGGPEPSRVGTRMGGYTEEDGRYGSRGSAAPATMSAPLGNGMQVTVPAGSKVVNNADGTVTITAPDGETRTYRNGQRIQ